MTNNGLRKNLERMGRPFKSVFSCSKQQSILLKMCQNDLELKKARRALKSRKYSRNCSIRARRDSLEFRSQLTV